MPKWERNAHDDKRQIQSVEDGRYIGHAIIPADAYTICEAHNADIDALTAERDKWRDAVIDAAVVNWTYTKEDDDSPYLAVCKLLACAAQDALDPQISLDAKALHDRIAELEADLDNSNAYATWVDGLTAELATVTTERDELQRRLDAVVAKISEAVVSDDDCVCSMLCHSAIIAIAEDE